MVCLGNICRSPLAHGIMQHLSDNKNLGWEIDSAGTGGWHVGEAPHRLSQKVARYNGLDISSQQARKLSPVDFGYYDLILFMDADNKQDGKSIAGANWSKSATALLMDVMPAAQYPREVPDPYYGGEQGFHEVYQMVHDACEAWINKLTQTN